MFLTNYHLLNTHLKSYFHHNWDFTRVLKTFADIVQTKIFLLWSPTIMVKNYLTSISNITEKCASATRNLI